MSQTGTNTTSVSTTLEQAYAKLKAWAGNVWAAAEADVDTLISNDVPVLEEDIVKAIETYGEDLIDDAIQLIEAGLSAPATISTVASNLIKKAGAQGESVAISLATTVAGQVVTAAQVQAAALKVAPVSG